MSDDIIVRLKAVEAAEMDVANSCDLPPNLTANWEYAMAVRDGIAELAALRARVAELEADAARYQFIKANVRRLDINGLCLSIQNLEVRIDQMRDVPSAGAVPK